MTPEERQLLRNLDKRLTDIETGRNLSFIKELERRLASGQISVETGASAAGTFVAVRNAIDTGSETVAEQYTGVLTLYSNGRVIGRIGYYT